MKKQDKLNYLFNNHYSEWIKTRTEVDNELSEKQSMFCVCGKLATGLHESHCKRFKAKVDNETLNRLKHLIK